MAERLLCCLPPQTPVLPRAPDPGAELDLAGGAALRNTEFEPRLSPEAETTLRRWRSS